MTATRTHSEGRRRVMGDSADVVTALPALPSSADLVTPDQAALIERHIAVEIHQLDDMGTANEWLARADALAAYLKHKESEGPMLGAMRRVEARIGELLGEAPGRGRKEMGQHADSFHREIRSEFRALAHAVRRGVLCYDDDSDDSPWRASRRALLLYQLFKGMGGLKSSTGVEWYTPERYIEAAREVLNTIDLDPASSAQANEVVKAAHYFDEDTDGLMQDWHGHVFCNPPYGKGTGLFANKLVEEYAAGRVSAAILLINAYGFDSDWFQPLWDYPICFTNHRIEFWSPQRNSGGSANANLFIYLGPDRHLFIAKFSEFGRIVQAVDCDDYD